MDFFPDKNHKKILHHLEYLLMKIIKTIDN